MTAALLRANRRTFKSLRKHRNYRLFFSGQVVSVSGTWMQNIATAWLVLELTGSPIAVGVLALCQFLPFTLFSLFAGVVVDRFDPRRIVIATQASAMVLAAALAALTFSGVIEAWHVFVLTALRGATLVVDNPARQALTFQMVGPEELPNAVALNSSLFNGARVVGPALGGVVIAAAGVGACFALNAVSFLAVLAVLLAMRPSELHPLARDGEPPRLLGGIREAIAYVGETRVAGIVLGTVLVVSVFSFNFNVLLPVLAKETLGGGAPVFGIISACFGAGALVGALTSASIGRASRKVLLVGTGGFGLSELLLAPLGSVLAASVLLFFTGLCFTLWTSNANSTLQLAAPDHLRGRVLGLYFFVFNGTMPAGGLFAGWLAASGGTRLAFGVAGGAALAATAFAALLLRRGQLRARRERFARLATIDTRG
ncbi:MAG: MFS transporter [Actinobacteria bacterium]|nr:MFS transporter [Actinomycetota bacterium]